MSGSSRFVSRATHVAARLIGGEMMIMSGRDSSLFCLNETATFVWQHADGRATLEAIAQRLAQEFDVDPQAAARDLEGVAEDLAAHGILLLADSPFVPGEAP